MSIIDSLRCKFGSHNWSSWRPVEKSQKDPSLCESIRSCYNCGRKETKQEAHSWGEWSFIGDESANQKRYCNHCRAPQTRQASAEEVRIATQRAMVSEPTAWDKLRQHLTSLPIVSQNEVQRVAVIDGVDKAIFVFIWCKVGQKVFKEISKYARVEKSPVEHLYLYHNTGDGGDPWVTTTTTIIKVARVDNDKYITLAYSTERGSQVPWGTEVPY